MQLVSARKIGVTDPVTEIILIFFTLIGVALLLLALVLYLRQRGHMSRMLACLQLWYRRYALNEEE